MSEFYYRIDHNRLNRGKLLEVRSGMYQGNLELHIRRDGLDDPVTIPIRLEKDIDWDSKNRSNSLKGTCVAIQFPNEMKEYRVVCDYDTMDGQCVVVKPLLPSQPKTHSQENG